MVSQKWDYGGYKLSTNRMFGMKKEAAFRLAVSLSLF